MYCIQMPGAKSLGTKTADIRTESGLWADRSTVEPCGYLKPAALNSAPASLTSPSATPTLWISTPAAPCSPASITTGLRFTASLEEYKTALLRKGCAEATIGKYLHNIRVFLAWLGTRVPTPELIRTWMTEKETAGTAASSINGMLSALNGFWKHTGHHACVAPLLKIDRGQYVSEEKLLTEKDFRKLLAAAKGNPQALTLLQAIASTGVRVSEVRYFTVESVKDGVIRVTNKGKTRRVILHKDTKKLLLDHCRRQRIRSGIIFRNKKGAALSRGYIWFTLKKIGKKAGLPAGKVFPHNLRRFFAVRVYRQTKDIDFVRVSLGHRSADTTGIYIKGSLGEHRRRLDRLKLVG